MDVRHGGLAAALLRLVHHRSDVTLLLLLSVVAPSCDVYSDSAFILMLATSGHLTYSAWMLLPQTVNSLFTLLLWWRLEPVQYRSWSWLLVLLQCWPQAGSSGQTVSSTFVRCLLSGLSG